MSGRGGPLPRYFSDAPDPLPSHQSLERLAKYVKEYGKPSYLSFSQKEKFDPEVVASKLKHLPPAEVAKQTETIYHETLAREHYRTPGRYFRAVMDEMANAIYGKRKVIDAPVYQKKRLRTDLPYGSFQIKSILNQVRKEMKLRRSAPEIRWSRKPLKSSWGFYRESDKTVVINCALKTRAISRSTMEFLIYHELLHHELGIEVRHGDQFTSMERAYPGMMEADAELDTLLEHYRIEGMEKR